MASLHSKSCLLLFLLTQVGIFVTVLTVISRKVTQYTVAGAGAVDDAPLSPSFAVDWNDSTSRKQGLRYLSFKDLDHLRSGRGSAVDASTINIQMSYDGEVEVGGEQERALSFNCSLAAAGAGKDRELSPWCTVRRYADTVDVQLLGRSRRLPEEVMNKVKYFVLFVGHSRSGSSITGALLDAHPNAVIGHEFHVFKNMLLHPDVYYSRDTIYTALALSSQISASHWRNTPSQRRHNMYIKDLWMGHFEDSLRVIGDKGAMSMTTLYLADKTLFLSLLHRLKAVTGVPIKFVQVIRNPFDNIATALIYNLDGGRLKAVARQTNGTVIDGAKRNLDVLRNIRSHFNHAIAVDRLKRVEGLDVLQLHLSDLVHSPLSELRRLCSFLDLECCPRYLDGCRAALFKEVSRTRHKVQWTQDQITSVERLAAQVHSLERYSFSSD